MTDTTKCIAEGHDMGDCCDIDCPSIPRRARIDLTTAKLLRDTLAQLVGSSDPDELKAMRQALDDAKKAGADVEEPVFAAIDVLQTHPATEPNADEPPPAPSLQQRLREWDARKENSRHEGLQIFSALEALSSLVYRALHPSPHRRAAGDQQTSDLVDAAIALFTIADLREVDLLAEIEKRISK